MEEKHRVTHNIELLIFISDISHMTRSADLHRHGKKTVLVKGEGSFLTDDEERTYSEVVDMNDFIEIYCDT
jgi:hypothetical protein